MRRIPFVFISVVCLLAIQFGDAQAPIALPYTMTTIGGTSPMAATTGTQCPNLPAGVVSTDAFGDGCLAVNGIFGVSAFSGLVVDPFGNVLVNDDVKGVLHLINPNSGMMTLVAGGGTACAGKQDSSGDGCIAATGTPTAPITGARGVGIDPYGNILLAGYNDHLVHIICRNASPLCGSGTPSAASPIQIPVGNLGLIAGCAYSSGSSGVTGAGVDNTPAFSLPTAGFSGSPFVNAGGSSSACNSSLGDVDQPRGVSADAYGNVYYADTTSERWRVVLGPQTYNGVTNPLWAVLEQNASWYNGTTKLLSAGYVYTIAGGSTTATTKGSSCAGGGVATDADGDGCLFTAATVFASTSDAQGVAVDAAGNIVFSDAGHGLLRVLFVNGAGAAGAAMVNAIEVNNEGMSPSSPQPGFVYSLAGGGTTGGVSATPALGNSRTALDTSTTKLTVSPQGNIFIGDKTRVLFFDMNTGFIRTLISQASSNVAAGNYCNGSAGQKSLSAYSDACPAANAEFGNSNGLSVGVDGAGNLYLYDGTSSSTGQLVRKVLAQGIAEQSLGVSLIQNFEVHLPETAAGTVSGTTATLTSTPDMTAATPSCTQNADNSVDCLVSVTATPSAVGLRSAALTVTLPVASWENASGSVALGGTIAGSVLVADNASTTASGVTTPVSPTTNAVLTGIVPAGVALDGAANVYVMDANSGSILESVQGAAGAVISSHLPTNPSQIAVDQLGDVFAVGSGTPSIEELKVNGAPASAGSPPSFTSATIAYATINNGTPAPQGIGIDNAGDLYIADNQGSPANNAIYRITPEPNPAFQQVTVATGFSNPVSVAVDGAGNVIVADKGANAVYKLVPNSNGSYTQTTLLSGVTPVAVATDPAGNVYVQDQGSATVIEVPLSGAETPVLMGLQSPTGVAVDGLGNLYSADATKMNILQVVRDAGSYGSNTSPLTSIAATLTNVGNQAAAGTAQTQSSAFTISALDCRVGSTSVFASGLACPLTAELSSSVLQNPGAAYTDALSFLAAPSIGSVSFSDIVPAGPTSMTLVGPANPLFASSGTEATFTATVTGISSPSGSTISVTVSSITLSGNSVVYSSTPTLNASGQAAIALSGLAPGNYAIAVSYAGVTNTYSPSSASASFTVEQYVATGDSRIVTEPSFPAVCTVLNSAIAMVNNDIPASVDSSVSNPDGARIQAALNGCAGTGQAVELSLGGGGNDAFLSGPLSMPSNVTLLVDPGVVLFFSRNVQDYDATPGTHTCGTVNSNSATASCLPLIGIPGGSTNVGIMGFGKIDGRGGDPLLNAFPSSFAGQSWWGLSSIANNGGNQQNPRFIQMNTGSSGITLYKITLRNSPLFHISTTGAVSNFTAWDIKIVTPTSSRNTDGIDPGNAQNFTITRSWISDGDDNIAVGAAGSAPAANISVTNNRFFAGHGESIGSYTQGGVSNVLFDSNMLSGNGIAGVGSSINNTADSNSTGLRIKSGFDRGGLVTNIQYSNSCFQDHKAEIVFSPNYENTTGSLAPNLQSILIQNIAFLTAGTVQLTGTSDNGTLYPLGLTLDNVSFPSPFATSEFSPTPTETAMTYGPGQVSSDFVADYATFAGANGNTVTNNITATNLNPPVCSFTYIAPELTGPNGVPQTITEGQNATAVAILTPAVGGAAYPTGTVTLTDALTSATTTIALPGNTDTFFIPLTGLTPGTHSFTATYSGDSNYTLSSGQTAYSTAGPYVVTVNAGSLSATSTALSGVPTSIAFGSSFTATATITGSNPTGTVEFIVNGTVYESAAVSSGSASATLTLPYSTSAFNIYAVYSGDTANDGSTSASESVTVTPALTTTALSANTTTTTLGHPVALTATVTSSVGAPTGTVTFTYTTTGSGTPQATIAALVASSTPDASVATAGIDLPTGTDNVTAAYTSSGSFAGSASAPMTFTVTNGTIVPLPANPIPLAYTMTTIAGGATANCAGETDSFGDGCAATSILFGGSVDLRSVVADPFGNVYLTDAVASTVRRIAPNGVITDFAGKVSGSACAPSATVGCLPTQVTLNKPRGIAADAQGNIYIAGYSSQEVFKVSVSTGLLYLVAGTGSAGSSGDGGPAASAQVNAPRGVWADTVGNVYIADTSNNKIRVVDIAGNIHTFAGTGTASSSGDSGLATSATINNPQGVMTDVNLNVYIADSSGGKIRVVCVTCGTGSPLDSLLATLGISSPQNGYIYTIAGGGSSTGPYPTLATSVSMSPQKLAIDLSGNIYISDGNGVAWFLDAHTANIRPIAGGTSSNCSSAIDGFGDGCPATQAVIGDGGNGIGVGTDALGNLYISDTLKARIRKVVTGLAAPATATASTTNRPVELHFINGDTVASTSGLAYTAGEWSLSPPACTLNSDSTSDCLLTSSFTPAVPGVRSAPLTVNSAQGNTSALGLIGIGLGAGATLDPATQSTFGSGLAVAGLAADHGGNIYVSDSNTKQVFRFTPAAQAQGATATGTPLATFAAPGAIAIDPRGFMYVADTSAGTVTQISPAGTATPLPFTFTTPAGLAVDALNNLYVSDSAAQVVYQIDPITGVEHTLALGTLVSPAGLAIDPAGNLLVADPGAPAVYRLNFATGTRTTIPSTAVAPSAALTDAAGNLLIADTASILAVPASPNSSPFTVASLTPSAFAVDSAGNLYTGSAGAVLKLTRTQGYVQFAAFAGPHTVNLLESGNQALQLSSVNQTDTGDYSLTASASTDCTVNSTLPSALTVGGACALTATYMPTTFATTTDTATFNGNLANAALSTPSSVQLTLTGPTVSPTAALISPTPGKSTVLGTSNVPFQWSAGTGVTLYELTLSATAPGASDLFLYKGTATSAIATSLPANGVTVYARLYSKINGAWYFNDYLYTEGGTLTPAILTSPSPGPSTVLGTSNVVFQWSTGTGVTDYQLNLSATASGASDLYSYKGTATSTIVPTIPANAVIVYATLYSKINGVWQSNAYEYTESGTPTPATLTSPTPGLTTILGTSNVQFQWTAGTAVTDYQLNLSAIAAGDSDLFLYKGTALSASASSLPANGVKVYARLYSRINGAWQYNDFVYTESGTLTPAILTSPSPGPSTVLGTSNVAFQWSTGTGVSEYQLNLSAIAPGGTDLYVYKGSGTSTTVSTLPANGATVYARLYSKINGAWQYNDYVYTEQ